MRQVEQLLVVRVECTVVIHALRMVNFFSKTFASMRQFAPTTRSR